MTNIFSNRTLMRNRYFSDSEGSFSCAVPVDLFCSLHGAAVSVCTRVSMCLGC